MQTHYAAPRLKHFGNLVLIVAAFIGSGGAMAIPDTPTYHKEVLYLGAFMVFLLCGVVKYLRMPYRIMVHVNGVDGLHELVSWLRQRNPALQVRGL